MKIKITSLKHPTIWYKKFLNQEIETEGIQIVPDLGDKWIIKSDDNKYTTFVHLEDAIQL